MATSVGIAFLAVFFINLFANGVSRFIQTYVELDVDFHEDLLILDGEFDPRVADFDALIRRALPDRFPSVSGRSDLCELYRIVSIEASFIARELLIETPTLIGKSVGRATYGRRISCSDVSTRRCF